MAPSFLCKFHSLDRTTLKQSAVINVISYTGVWQVHMSLVRKVYWLIFRNWHVIFEDLWIWHKDIVYRVSYS